MRRIPLVCGNWKMHKTIAESITFVRELRAQVGAIDGIEVVLAPPFTALNAVADALEGSSMTMAAQDCFWEEKGAWTGEVSPGMCRDAGARYVILGHSERRQHFGETDERVARKTKAALKAGLLPIVCIGETLEEREAGSTLTRIHTQLTESLRGVPPSDAGRLVIAYEPVWAIGTGLTATPHQAQEVHALVREQLREQFAEGCERIRILYGGSVKPELISPLMAQPDIDGALVGGASLEAKSFLGIVRFKRS